ncbi:uncharacterized protein [Parasteatoda tepidariorum]|uniref:uncharacterized protein n=1 Tax=Parasteatoda tepidariorum TaxID=114398 RepID=UPI00077FDCBD|nr:uncharacterized protein LOC107456399 [Parasteatoda tepidariorum]
MRKSSVFVHYLMFFVICIVTFEPILCGEYSEYPSYESKQYEHHHHDYHPPAKKGANIDINIPFDIHTLAKMGLLGLTKLNLLLALGKVAGASLGVSALGLSKLGKIALQVGGHGHKGGGIAIDIGAPHAKSHSHYEEKHYVPEEKHY